MTAELIGLNISPYTEKARWALDHHRMHYHYNEHLIIFGMPALRAKTRRFTGEVTVPVYIDGDHRLLDSFDIARFADEHGSSAKLFPASRAGELDRYRALSEEGLDAGRAVLLPKLAADREARVESIPSMFPRALKPVVLPLVSVGLKYLSREFGVDASARVKNEDRLRKVLLTLRQNLYAAGGHYLLGDFSFADVLMAVVLQFIEPVAQKYMPIGAATRRCLTSDGLRTEFADLVKWRDSIYQKHRGRSLDS
ncbi:MAG: glutathione S-transferase [Deltaproteobacteria bacterium]|nr:glutathione S-transferase [Deltaproteobacteria bacterium]